ncbi:hypothetical protein MGG_17967 [Pyricularia oryzae 70-15]|uniref:Uncharacterized protein n=1 Tax=Pyricularia oryzae (strain 70-15 / ATCC MYA-4617 / FGSC 8958) TaxID=242507 RepID=G4NJ10_PYRO7|nr:uncharacterized protein MGG_17967 [Pyricularia oryzae 70-15]EHA46226.1 hypothetical protein MGG_17967 [Pyricularia oryzae 70-15]
MARPLQTQRSQTEARASRRWSRKDKTPSVGTLGLAYLSTFSLQDIAGLQAESRFLVRVNWFGRPEGVSESAHPRQRSGRGSLVLKARHHDLYDYSVDGLNGSGQGLNLSESKGMQGGRGTGHSTVDTHSQFVSNGTKINPCIGGVLRDAVLQHLIGGYGEEYAGRKKGWQLGTGLAAR